MDAILYLPVKFLLTIGLVILEIEKPKNVFWGLEFKRV